MPNLFLEILLILVLILINGFFAMAEISLVSARKVRLEQRAEDGDKGARLALELTRSSSRLLSAVQIGITLVGIFIGALGGATLAERLTTWLLKFSWLEKYASVISIILVVLLTTYFSLVLGELIPKRLAMNNPEKIASRVSGFMYFLSKVMAPVIHLLSASTDLGLKIIGIPASKEPPITEDEIRVLIEQGTQVGVFGEAEQDMVESVFRLNDRSINAIMTPRTEIEWLDANDPPEQIIEQILTSTHSRFPVAQSSLDNVVGILSAKDVLEKHITKTPYDLLKLISKPLFVPENTPALRMLEMSREAGVHEAMVIDEYGGLLGMVTLFDVLEAIVGNIPSYDEVDQPEIVLREDGSYLLDGLLPIDELKELLEVDELPEEDKVGFQTVGGFVMNQIGSIPTVGQHFHWMNFRFEIVDMDNRRVDKVLVNLFDSPKGHATDETGAHL
ncbi:MAG: hemolysin family protein [Chloroflexi bacterium]|nr:hemolysin family protein [Chloroflexota bacterium]